MHTVWDVCNVIDTITDQLQQGRRFLYAPVFPHQQAHGDEARHGVSTEDLRAGVLVGSTAK